MPAVPVLAAIGGGSAVAGGITAGTAALGAYSSIKGASDAKKAANTAANTPAPTVNIPALQTQAQNIAQQNAAASAALEQQYNPGAADLRAGSLEALLTSLNPQTQSTLMNLAQGGAPGVSAPGARPGLSALGERPETSAANAALLAQIQSQAGQPLTTAGFDSALTRSAVEQAAADLALGGQLPQDVRNLVARTAAARSGAVSGGLGLGRDITARDLGLTSLDLRNQRLARAAALGGQEAALEQANAAMRSQAEQFGRANLLQSQAAIDAQDARAAQNYATDAQIAAARDALASNAYATDAQLAAQRDALASSNYFNQAGLLQNIASGDFARAFQAAQLGQSIQQPTSGLDPGSVANLAVGNTNAVANKAQQDAAARIAAANQQSAMGGQLLGIGAGMYANRTPAQTTYGTYTPPQSSYIGGIIPGFG
jgi:hypothetical protein